MKSIKDYILENIEVEPSDRLSGYRTVTLVKRTGIDCSKLSKEEFISMFTEDYKKAVKEASDLLDKEHEESKEERVAKVKAAAEKYASEKWKRESNRKKYIDNAVANETSKERDKWRDISYFDFDVDFGRSNSINDFCIIREQTLNSLGKVYDILADENSYANTFWKEATGWAFKYNCPKDSYRNSFRPWIDLIVSDTKREEIKQNEKHLADAIEKFYAGSNYWGD